MGMIQLTREEFKRIFLDEVVERWPKWNYTARDEDDWYLLLSKYSFEQIKAAVQKYRVTIDPRSPKIGGIKKYLPQRSAAPTTPKRFENVDLHKLRIKQAAEGLRIGNKTLVGFIESMDPAAVEKAEQQIQAGNQFENDNYKPDLTEIF